MDNQKLLDKIDIEFDKEFGDLWVILEHKKNQLPKLERRNRQIKEFYEKKIQQAEQEMVNKVAKYFDGLLVIYAPQRTKTKLISFLQDNNT